MRWILIVLALVLVSGCTTDQTAIPPTTQWQATTAASPTLEQTPEETGGESNELVIQYQREGGVAGVSEGWIVYADGRVQSSDGQEYQVGAEQVSDTVAEVLTLGFFELGPGLSKNPDCRDCFEYTLLVSSGNKAHSISFQDGGGLPKELVAIVGAVNELVLEAQAK